MEIELFNYDNVSWNLPLMFCHDEMIFTISDILKDFPDIKRPKLYSYGSITSPWAGGRETYFKFFEYNFLENHLNKIIASGFIPTFTFTKPFIKTEDLEDKHSNWILAYGVEHSCEFLVTSDVLYNYIKEKYPEAKLSASILQGKMEFHNPNIKYSEELELEFYNKKSEYYDRVVIRPEFAINCLEKNLSKIKDITKFEVLINETCLPYCKNAIKCYSYHDKIISLDNYKNDVICSEDTFLKKYGIKKTFENKSLMMDKLFIDKLVNDFGIKHLKVQGRQYYISHLFNIILYYLFKEDGKFQSIYPYLVDICRKYKFDMSNFPYEQRIILKNILIKNSIYSF